MHHSCCPQKVPSDEEGLSDGPGTIRVEFAVPTEGRLLIKCICLDCGQALAVDSINIRIWGWIFFILLKF